MRTFLKTGEYIRLAKWMEANLGRIQQSCHSCDEVATLARGELGIAVSGTHIRHCRKSAGIDLKLKRLGVTGSTRAKNGVPYSQILALAIMRISRELEIEVSEDIRAMAERRAMPGDTATARSAIESSRAPA